MTNFVKVGTSNLISLQIKNFSFGVKGLTNYGPTTNTGFYQGIKPPDGGYTIYVVKYQQGPSMHVAENDERCIWFLKSFGATGDTISEVLNWVENQTDIYVTNREFDVNDLTGSYNFYITEDELYTYTDEDGNTLILE